MRTTCAVTLLWLLVCTQAAAEPPAYRLADTRSDPDAAPRKPGKLAVVAITDKRDVRNQFEDKFASHLRGQGIGAMASHSIVPDLTALDDRERILEFIAAEGIDGAITIVATPLEPKGEAAWAADWADRTTRPGTLRELIERTVPVPEKAAKHYGIEFALWHGPSQRVWSARTDIHSRKELRSGVAELLQLVIRALVEAEQL